VSQNNSVDSNGRGRSGKKLLAVWEWYSEDAAYCRDCVKMHKQTGKQLDCQDCENMCPELLPVNRRIFDLLCCTSTQWRVSMNGLVGMDYPAVYQTARIMGVKINPIVLKKIRAVERHVLEAMRSGK